MQMLQTLQALQLDTFAKRAALFSTGFAGVCLCFANDIPSLDEEPTATKRSWLLLQEALAPVDMLCKGQKAFAMVATCIWMH
jgi:hypothetical protein